MRSSGLTYPRCCHLYTQTRPEILQLQLQVRPSSFFAQDLAQLLPPYIPRTSTQHRRSSDYGPVAVCSNLSGTYPMYVRGGITLLAFNSGSIRTISGSLSIYALGVRTLNELSHTHIERSSPLSEPHFCAKQRHWYEAMALPRRKLPECKHDDVDANRDE